MLDGGSSDNPCSESFAGPRPFSEVEAVSLKYFIEQQVEGEIKIYLSFHSFGQYVLFPYGHTVEESPHHALLVS